MQSELFEHCAADNHNYFLTDCNITLIDGSAPTRREENWIKVLKTVTPYGLNTLNWWLLLHAFYTFFYAFLDHTCVFSIEFNFFILSCSIILFDGGKLISIADWLFGYYIIWDFPLGNFCTFCSIQWMHFFSFE